MRVIITGGTGLIGRALTTSLCTDHHDVVILSRTSTVSNLPAGAHALRWDGRTTTCWEDAVEGAAAIVNLAGASISAGRWTPQRRREIRESRIQATAAILSAITAAVQKPHVLIQASAVGYYGPHGDEEITEDSPPGNDFLADVCKATEAITATLNAHGVRHAVIRTGIVFSRDGGALPRLLFPFTLFVGGPIGSGRQWYPWIHIADEVGAIRFLIENSTSSGPYNLTAPQPLTNADLAQLIGHILHRPSVFPTPAFALRLALGDMATIVLDGQRVLPQRLLAAGYQFRFPTAEAALRDLLA